MNKFNSEKYINILLDKLENELYTYTKSKKNISKKKITWNEKVIIHIY